MRVQCDKFEKFNSITTQLPPHCYAVHLLTPHRTHSGVCHSDLGVMTCSWKTLPYPTQAGQVGGHEGVGKIVKMGPASDNKGVKVGDRVGIKWMAGICEACEACRAGVDASCFNGVSTLPLIPHKASTETCANISNRKYPVTTPPAPSSNMFSRPQTT
jgi:hypothetical protein